MDGVVFKAEGLDELRRDLRRIDKSWTKELGIANQQATEVIAADARGRVHVRSGKLKRSIKGAKQAGRAILQMGSPGRVPYAGVVNWGWPKRNIQGNEVLYSAIAATSEQFLRRYEELIDKLIARVLRA